MPQRSREKSAGSFWSLDMLNLLPEPPASADPGSLDILEDHVQSRLFGRVRDFQVQRPHAGGLVLRGRARTYHAKQLAQHYVMEMTDWPILANEIEVV
jgi:hypothetical protein